MQRGVAVSAFGGDVATLVGNTSGSGDAKSTIVGRMTTEPLKVELSDNNFTDLWSIPNASSALPIAE